MKVRIGSIPPEGVQLSFVLEVEASPGMRSLAASEGCEWLGPVQATLDLVPRGDLYVAKGRFNADVRLTCARCLSRFDSEIAAPFDLTFESRVETPEPEETIEIELKAADMGIIYLEGEEIDFEPVVAEQLLMHYPMQPLCKTTCRGLCPGCGADLNNETCRCTEKAVDPRLAVLKQLKDRLPE